jgi:hypothetical protein
MDVIDDFTTLDVWYELFLVSLFLLFVPNSIWTGPQAEQANLPFTPG